MLRKAKTLRRRRLSRAKAGCAEAWLEQVKAISPQQQLGQPRRTVRDSHAAAVDKALPPLHPAALGADRRAGTLWTRRRELLPRSFLLEFAFLCEAQISFACLAGSDVNKRLSKLKASAEAAPSSAAAAKAYNSGSSLSMVHSRPERGRETLSITVGPRTVTGSLY